MTTLSTEEHRVDPLERIAGFWTAFILNLMLIVLAIGLMMDRQELSETPMVWLPWLFNLLILVVALWKYGEFAVGYLMGIALFAVATILYMPSCIGTCLVVGMIGFAPDIPYYGSNLEYWFWPAFFILYVCLWALIGVYFSFRHYRNL